MDNNKIKIRRIINKLKELWNKHPNERFFQLLFNYTQLGTTAGISKVKDPFYYLDSKFEEYLDYWIKLK